MKSIIKKEVYEITIKNSKFIGVIIPIETLSEVKINLNKLKEEYKGANHYCYAFKLIDNKGFSDDKEPNKTAGIPILKVIESEDLVNVLVVVIRYFGGIKLGPGGLIRAYSDSCRGAINKCSKISLIKGFIVSVTFPYSLENEVNYILGNSNIKRKEYTDKCSYVVEVSCDVLNKLNNLVTIDEKIEKIIPKLN